MMVYTRSINHSSADFKTDLFVSLFSKYVLRTPFICAILEAQVGLDAWKCTERIEIGPVAL